MIKYDKLWKTMKEKGITTYALTEKYNVNKELLHRLRHNMNVEMNTIDKLCNLLGCDISDIAEHFPDSNVF